MIPVLFLIVVVPSVLAIAYTFLFKPTLLIRYAAVLSGMGVQFMGARPSPVVSRASEHPEDLTGILKNVYAPYREIYAYGLKNSHEDLKRSSPPATPKA